MACGGRVCELSRRRGQTPEGALDSLNSQSRQPIVSTRPGHTTGSAAKVAGPAGASGTPTVQPPAPVTRTCPQGLLMQGSATLETPAWPHRPEAPFLMVNSGPRQCAAPRRRSLPARRVDSLTGAGPLTCGERAFQGIGERTVRKPVAKEEDGENRAEVRHMFAPSTAPPPR